MIAVPERSFADIFLRISGVCYLILMGDLLLMITTVPVWALVFFTPLDQSWMALALVAPILAPAVSGAFAAFQAYVEDGSTAVVRSFLRGWASQIKKTLVLGAALSGLVVVLVVNLHAAAGTAWGALAAPGYCVTGLLGVVAFFTGLALIGRRPEIPRWQAMKAGLIAGVRGGLWSLVSLAALGVFAAMLWQRAALALIAAPAPVLFVVWYDANRAILGRVAPPEQNG